MGSEFGASIRSTSETETRVDAEDVVGITVTDRSGIKPPMRRDSTTLRDWQRRLTDHQATIQALTSKLTCLQEEQHDHLKKARENFDNDRRALQERYDTLQADLAAQTKKYAAGESSTEMSDTVAALVQTDSTYGADENNAPLTSAAAISAAAAAADAMATAILPTESFSTDMSFEASQSEIFYDASAMSSESMVHRSLLFKDASSSPQDSGPLVVDQGLRSPLFVDPHREQHVQSLRDKIHALEADKYQLLEKVHSLEYELESVSNRKELVAKQFEAAIDRNQFQQLELQNQLLNKARSASQPLSSSVPSTPLPSMTPTSPPTFPSSTSISRSLSMLAKGLKPSGIVSAPRSAKSTLANPFETPTPMSPSALPSDDDTPLGNMTSPLGPLPPTPPGATMANIPVILDSEQLAEAEDRAMQHQAEAEHFKRENQQLEAKNQQLSKSVGSMEEELLHMADLNDQLEEELTETKHQLAVALDATRLPVYALPLVADRTSVNTDLTGFNGSSSMILASSHQSEAPLAGDDHLDAMLPPASPNPAHSMSGFFQSSFGPLERPVHTPRGACQDPSHHRMVQDNADLHQRTASLQVLVDEQQSKIQRQESTIAHSDLRFREAETRVLELEASRTKLEAELQETVAQKSELEEQSKSRNDCGHNNNDNGDVNDGKSTTGLLVAESLNSIDHATPSGSDGATHSRLRSTSSIKHGSAFGDKLLASTVASAGPTPSLRSKSSKPNLRVETPSDPFLGTLQPSSSRGSTGGNSIYHQQHTPGLTTPTFHPLTTPTTIKYTDTEVTQMRSRITNLESDIQAHLNLIQTLESELTESEAGREKSQEEIEELSHQILNHTSEIKAYRDQINQLRLQLDEAKNWADQEKRKVEMLKLKNRELAEEITELKASKKSTGGFLCF
ncbi:hypothetical protein BJ085DRAFT_31917 [Dimargaris cristalligena]|uniref:Uncharacterized protein n=1 Tax=Dimargaris cristalligena TaxID=215637 RepID=A0A4V1J4T4_9FUNG|nr:hypothetical protein BJ085DRAFT_31917 [Dimargaris cristalligena]|eukprot:RKP36669.1 hypothetical protein BJ085DRAFT_31917 [Dimargaris cristalligena]